MAAADTRQVDQPPPEGDARVGGGRRVLARWLGRQWPQVTVNLSHEPTRVASEWMVSVVRPPPPTAVR